MPHPSHTPRADADTPTLPPALLGDMARPTGTTRTDTEELPEYDESPHTDAYAIQAWLAKHLPDRWGAGAMAEHAPNAAVMVAERDRQLVADVIGALQVTGDATIVKNPTYRAMVRDGRDVERLAAGLARHGLSMLLVESGGNPVTAALTVIEQARKVADDWAVVRASLPTPVAATGDGRD